MRRSRTIGLATAFVSALGLMAAPARAGESVLGAEVYPVVGSGPASFTSGWTHYHPRADLRGGCDDALQFNLRLTLNTDHVTATELALRSVTLEWRAKTGGNFAGYALWGDKTYAAGRTGSLGEPDVPRGHHFRTYPMAKTVKWGEGGTAYFQENFSFEGEGFGGAITPMPVAYRTPEPPGPPQPPAPRDPVEEKHNVNSFPDICRSHAIVFHILRTNPGGGDGGCGIAPTVPVALATREPAAPATKC